MNEFETIVKEFSEKTVTRSSFCLNEESVKQSLVLPFLSFLGYDIFNIEEIWPEHHADFSEKYPNRVDYAIRRAGQPVIALEVKGPGAELRDDRGQLKSYFNAVLSVKMAILTNGLVYECYADTDEPNMMDDTPFLRIDLQDLANGKVAENVLNGIQELRKDNFDPANIGAEAKKKLLLRAFVNTLHIWHKAPDDDVVRSLLESADYSGKKTARILDETRDLVKQAFSAYVDQNILQRVGFAERSVVKVDEKSLESTLEANSTLTIGDGIITTEQELYVYNYALRRLAFLCKDETAFEEIKHVQWQDLKTTFKVFYKRPVIGSLFNFKEGRDGQMIFEFPALNDETVTTTKLSDIDAPLAKSFEYRIKGDSKPLADSLAPSVSPEI